MKQPALTVLMLTQSYHKRGLFSILNLSVFLHLMGGRIADHIFNQHPNRLTLIAEMFGNLNAGFAVVEIQGAISFRHIERGNFVRFSIISAPPLVNHLLLRLEHRLIAST